MRPHQQRENLQLLNQPELEALVLARMRNEALAKRLAAGLCAVAGVLFVVFYPALSGLPIPDWWADALQILPSFGLY